MNLNKCEDFGAFNGQRDIPVSENSEEDSDGFTEQGSIPVIEPRVIMSVSQNWMELSVRWVRERSWNHRHNVLKGTDGEGARQDSDRRWNE